MLKERLEFLNKIKVMGELEIKGLTNQYTFIGYDWLCRGEYSVSRIEYDEVYDAWIVFKTGNQISTPSTFYSKDTLADYLASCTIFKKEV